MAAVPSASLVLRASWPDDRPQVLRIILVVVMLGPLSYGVGTATSSTTESPDRKALDTATRDFVVPMRGCVQVVEAFVGLWNGEKNLSADSKMPYRIHLLSYLQATRSSCRAARAQMLQVSTSGFVRAAKDGRRAFSLFLSGMTLFDDGARHRAESFFVRARNQFVRGLTAFKRAMTRLNGKRAAVGLGPLPLRVRP